MQGVSKNGALDTSKIDHDHHGTSLLKVQKNHEDTWNKKVKEGFHALNLPCTTTSFKKSKNKSSPLILVKLKLFPSSSQHAPTRWLVLGEAGRTIGKNHIPSRAVSIGCF